MTEKEAIAYIKAIKNGLHETGKDFPYRDEIIPVAKEALDMAIKTLEQETCEDVISRQAAIVALDNRMSSLENMDMQIAMGFAKGIINDLPPVTPQPCEDCISREAVIKTISEWFFSKDFHYTNAAEYLRNRLDELPSVTLQPKMGKWIYNKKEDSYKCSLCTFPCHKDNLGAIPTRYCANCGSYNGGEL